MHLSFSSDWHFKNQEKKCTVIAVCFVEIEILDNSLNSPRQHFSLY